tara:strand:+ start:930 stop:1313 length:384 start_codon:yes stop_codon:yes gene_type:complete
MITTMQELIRENETLKKLIAQIEDARLQMRIAEDTVYLKNYKADTKKFNDAKKELRTQLENSSAYQSNLIKLCEADNIEDKRISITDRFSITAYKKQQLDDKAIKKYYSDNDLALPIIINYTSQFNV